MNKVWFITGAGSGIGAGVGMGWAAGTAVVCAMVSSWEARMSMRTSMRLRRVNKGVRQMAKIGPFGLPWARLAVSCANTSSYDL